MNMIYNSPNYCVVAFHGPDGEVGGFEIMDKFGGREIYIGGDLAEHFQSDVQDLIQTQPSEEQIDDFLSRFEGLMQHPLVVH